jgi:hypothetical protein
MQWFLAVSVLVYGCADVAAAQDPTGTIRVEVRAAEKPLPGAHVVVAGTTYRTDGFGIATIASAPGAIQVTIAKDGFVPATVSVNVVAGAQQDDAAE